MDQGGQSEKPELYSLTPNPKHRGGGRGGGGGGRTQHHEPQGGGGGGFAWGGRSGYAGSYNAFQP